jgi:hypothetical protein
MARFVQVVMVGRGAQISAMRIAPYYSVSARNAQVRVMPNQQHNIFISNKAVALQQIVIKLRKASVILYTGLRNFWLIQNIFWGCGLTAFWLF